MLFLNPSDFRLCLGFYRRFYRRFGFPDGRHDIIDHLIRIGNKDDTVHPDEIGIFNIIDLSQILHVDVVCPCNAGQCLPAFDAMVNPFGMDHPCRFDLLDGTGRQQ